MSAPAPSPAEQAVIDRFEVAEPAPESWDANAAVRRVLELAADFDDGSEWGTIQHPGHVVRASILAALEPPR